MLMKPRKKDLTPKRRLLIACNKDAVPVLVPARKLFESGEAHSVLQSVKMRFSGEKTIDFEWKKDVKPRMTLVEGNTVTIVKVEKLPYSYVATYCNDHFEEAGKKRFTGTVTVYCLATKSGETFWVGDYDITNSFRLAMLPGDVCPCCNQRIK
jgi:hypothetical protein